MGVLAARARRWRQEAEKRLPARRLTWRPSLEEPHVGQAEVLSQAETFNVLCMGRRWGKTRLGVRLAVEPMMEGYAVAWLVPEFAKASDIWNELENVLLPVIRSKNANLWEMELVTGGSIKFYSIDRNPDGPRGKNFRRVIVDEAAFTRKLEACLERSVFPTMVDDPEADLWLLSSPRGKNAFYSYWQRGQAGDLKRRGWKSWRKPSDTNPFLSRERLDALRAEVSDRIASIEYDADFDSGGVFFDDWQESLPDGRDWHVCTPFAVPSWWLGTGGLDFGKNVFAFGLFRWSPAGEAYLVREVTVLNGVESEQAVLVRKAIEAEGLDPSMVTIYADPSGFPNNDPKKRRGTALVEAFWSAGLRVVKAENDRAFTNSNAAEWLRAGLRSTDALAGVDRLDGVEFGKSFPRFRVFRGRAPELCRTIPLMEALDDNPDDFDSDGPDHHVDAILRYGLRPFKSPPRSKPEEGAKNIPLPARFSGAAASRGRF